MSATDDAAGPERLGHLPSFLMTQAARHVHRVVFDRLDAADARGHHYRVLAALEEYGPSSQIDLARRCSLDRSDVAGTVDALADRRFVERAPDPTDRRRNVVSLTRRGRNRLFDLDRRLTEAQEEAFAPLDDAEREQLVSMLTRLVQYHTHPAQIAARPS
ncbi:MarR family transcriptional regulator [Rhodococcus sp. Z13]|uniref:MarR family transcriptional regulator n=1 Tax=Rhodococcus sacchari TaxID=2962047 RepID=A0ACD4DF58_9NOCA|nr:MarR family transcriptional regulator [Rhodococcus sp. Z13]UYP18695.1 MarR family transcriptional regulator [Rhodococcus sp. Z13]